MNNLVSAIIPCFNSEKWLSEAIDSCLNQTYENIEIIVIDDGSTDNSLNIIKSYGERIIWETGTNRGGNYARNRGFELSEGEYIQYLDADDYILPEKIERQVNFIQETGADVVYGDWRDRYHLPGGEIVWGEIKVCGPNKDFTEFLLKGKYPWLTTIVPLFTRDAVIRSGGWDESLKAVQDRDFYISVALSGAKCMYQPGCYSIKRGSGDGKSVSTSNKAVWVKNNLLVLEKAEKKLQELGMLSEKYTAALAYSYFQSTTFCAIYFNYAYYIELLKKVKSLDSSFKNQISQKFSLLEKFFGFYLAGIILKFLKDVKNKTSMSLNR